MYFMDYVKDLFPGRDIIISYRTNHTQNYDGTLSDFHQISVSGEYFKNAVWAETEICFWKWNLWDCWCHILLVLNFTELSWILWRVKWIIILKGSWWSIFPLYLPTWFKCKFLTWKLDCDITEVQVLMSFWVHITSYKMKTLRYESEQQRSMFTQAGSQPQLRTTLLSSNCQPRCRK